MGSKKTECNICGKFVSVLTSHMRVHTGERPYRCKTCGESFACSSNLKTHQLTYIKTKDFACKTCHKCFSTKNKLGLHEKRMHSSYRPFNCTQCGKTFSQRKQLTQHWRDVHTARVREHICPFCKKGFLHNSTLRMHLITHSKIKPFKCDQCGKAFRYARSLKEHGMVHKPAAKIHKCDKCNKAYYLKSHLKSHQRIHSQFPWQKCSVCGKYVLRLKTHMDNAHIAKKSHKCTLCEKIFSSTQGLYLHIKIHTGERKMERCSICGKEYKTITGLQRHVPSHDKLPACVFCNREIMPHRVENHIRSHINEKPYSCQVCRVELLNSAVRSRHFQKFHAQ